MTSLSKNIEDISYEDIESLKKNEIDESDVLDYKLELLDNKKLVKHVCAFANTRGGDIIFGIKESGNGGCPTEICGLKPSDINKEKIEQIILSNTVPRLGVKMNVIEIPNSKNSILFIRVPDSHNKPHQNNYNKKYYKRFQFESAEMNEQEVRDSYKDKFKNHEQEKRNSHNNEFRNHEQVKQYLEKISSISTGSTPTDTITTKIIIIPSNIENRLIETTDQKKIEWFYSIARQLDTYNLLHNFIPSRFKTFAYGLISEESISNKIRKLCIHRNGCIEYVEHYIFKKDNLNYFLAKTFARRLMQSLQFTNQTLQHYNYFGGVKIIVKITCSCENALSLPDSDYSLIDKIDCNIEREHSLQCVKENYEKITSYIMDEIYNHYHVPSCDLFNENRKWIK